MRRVVFLKGPARPLSKGDEAPASPFFWRGISYATHAIYIMVRGVDHGEPGSFDPLKYVERVRVCFDSLKSHIIYFKTVVEQL